MTKRIYVGNLPFSASEDEVRDLFAQHGNVQSVRLINHKDTGKPRGFGFVEMEDNEAMAAISALDGFDMNGRALKINEAQAPERRPDFSNRPPRQFSRQSNRY